MPNIHYFNPGHETAVLQATENYTPPRNVQRMQRELAALPVWYAAPDDYVFAEENLSPRFFSLQPKELRPLARLVTPKELAAGQKAFPSLRATPWGLSPQSLRVFTEIRKKHLPELIVPDWNPAFARLTGRQTAAECLEKLRERLPGLEIPVTPKFCTQMRDIEKYLLLQHAPFVVKTPYSSSGRGLLWLHHRKLTEKEKNWILGALRKQGCVSIECGVEKVQDFAMEFYSDGRGEVRYEGLSVFATEQQGAYTGNVLEHPENMRRRLARWSGEESLDRVQEALTEVLKEVYGPVYTGYLGVDMLIYRGKEGGYAIHPCLEINMRYTMGMVALQLFRRYMAPSAQGDFRISYDREEGEAYANHCFMKKAYPLQWEGGRIKEGYLSLCPVRKETNYRAYMLIM